MINNRDSVLQAAARERRDRPGFSLRPILVSSTMAIAFLIVVALGLTALGQGSGRIALAWPLVLLDERLPMVFRLHMASAGLAIIAIALTLSARKRPKLHRPAGRIAAVLVLIAGVSALPSAILSEANAIARAGFFIQAVAWLALICAGIVAIRRGRRTLHAGLMIAMASVASGAVLLRPMLAATAALDLPFDETYAVLAWAAWLIPAAIAGMSLRAWRVRRPAS